jgi:rhodanese-related sulfurtransferase
MPESLEIDLDAFAEEYARGVTVIDVRNPDEYEEKHLAGAVLIPLGELEDRLDEVPRDTHLYVICAAGARSLRAAEALVDAGYDAVSVAGGTNGWASSGRPVVTGPEAG